MANSPIPEIAPVVAGANGATLFAASIFRDQSSYTAYRIGIRASFNQPIVGPMLGVAQTGLSVVLAWPTNAGGFKLQSTAALAPPVAWVDTTNTLVIVGSEFRVTNGTSGSNKFFRLKKN